MSLDFTDDQSTLVQVMAWCRQAINKPLPEPMLTQIFVDIWRVFGSTTRVTRVSSDNVNIVAEHQEPAEMSQLDNTSNPPVYGEYKCC